ncbi:phosphonoacetaldehyde hydrolase [Ancylobacter amanitiformis]|uniref:Phosphonoacetaldehyde hydrolase n=1 Tax=Ancylobacter amanitiformis TaxID=217069 RepID=A0ABU0LTE3_9HYPH|nr:phosphonoacetaldehyde hydrolase [Ancylobacter amanitiformis]MDQ0511987.1 phosphonoacetaldehyde hydrolase [Ancylobacter amanitiformis]
MAEASTLKALILDWAGTAVDFGSRAPMGAFVEAFGQVGVTISIPEARGPMGLPKRDHVAALLHSPDIAARWQAAHGAAPTEADIDRVLAIFEPLNVEVIPRHADLIPGLLDVVAEARRRGMKIGSTTGYTRPIMEVLAPLAAAAGYAPDNVVCAGDLAAGRPSPLMMYRTFADIGVWPPAACVKLDDTEPGIAEGLGAGTWTVGLALSGNAAGLSKAELDQLAPDDRAALRARASAALFAAGAHFVIDTVADLLPVLDAIEARLAAGVRP